MKVTLPSSFWHNALLLGSQLRRRALSMAYVKLIEGVSYLTLAQCDQELGQDPQLSCSCSLATSATTVEPGGGEFPHRFGDRSDKH